MKESKDRPKEFSTCFEGSPCAEMMQKIMGQEGIGWLCQEMMRSFGKTCRAENKGPQDVHKREAGEKDKRPGSQAAENEDKDQGTGGPK